MHRIGIWLFAGITLSLSVPPSAVPSGPPDQIAVVVNKANKMAGLSHGALKQIVLRAQAKWPDGERIVIVTLPPGQPERTEILQAVCSMSETEYSVHLLRGAGESPRVGGTSTQVRDLVVRMRGAIGFIRASDVDDSVNVVMIDGLLPGQAGYKIKAQ
jgi:hypothetical protein